MNKLFCIKKFSRFVLIMVFIFSSSILANSATFIVTKTADTNDGVCNADCSLREAIAEANINDPTVVDTINFDPALFSSAQTIILTLGRLLMSNGIFVINGVDANLLNISSNRQSSIFHISSEANVEINKITISDSTRGILSLGTLTLNDVVVRNNRYGGGIVGTGGTITINNSSITDNEIIGSGAGIQMVGDIIVNNSIISNNSSYSGSVGCGGGITISGGTGSLINTVISDNFATSGGGICGDQGAKINLTDTTIKDNFATSNGGGAFFAEFGMLNLNNVSVNNNSSLFDGGGIYNLGTITINRSEISSNSSTDITRVSNGGGIYNKGLLSLTNSTISENSTDDDGGGIYNAEARSVSLVNTTIAFNTATRGGGVFNNFRGTVNARNTIFARNSATTQSPDFERTLTSQGYNLIENTNGTTIIGTTTGNILGQDPKLLPLGNYGGANQTHALQLTSPAIDAADPNNFPPTDQRGVPRPQDGDLSGSFLPDIGAFELQQIVPPEELIESLIETIGNYIDNTSPRLRAGIERNLIAKLENALTDLAAGDTQGAKNELEAFINLVRSLSGELISQKRAEELIAEANKILAAINSRQ